MLLQAATVPVWSAIGQIATTAVCVLGALWAFVRTVGRPAFDNLVHDSVTRKRSDLERMLRTEVFHTDLAAVNATRQAIDRAALTAESNAQAIEDLVGRHDILDRELRALPLLAQSVEQCTTAVSRLSLDMGELSVKMERFSTIIEERSTK